MGPLQGAAKVQGTQLEQPRVKTIAEPEDASPIQGLTRRWLMRGSGGGSGGGERLPLVQRVLAARGLTDPGECERFQSPRLSDLHDPGLLPGVDRAVARLIEAIRGRQIIVIYGDYDVDGITATAILYHVIKTVAPDADVRTYVPHRLEEGYGLNAEALRQLRGQGAALVISVDCGISAIEPARAARECGLDLIITDHHALPQDASAATSELPDACALVHPRLPGSAYPCGDLCGAGVAFKLAWRFATTWCNSPRVSAELQKTLVNMLPLSALGTIADVAPLLGENRILAKFGLRLMAQSPLIGLRALIEHSGLVGAKIDSEKVGFILAPRLNACGRMGHAAEAVHLLTSANAEEARQIAARLSEANQLRQATERRIADEAARMAEDRGMTRDDRRIIVLADPAWHPGVVGIVCSRLVERFGRPAILLQRNGELCKGSARSIEGYSIHAALQAAREHLVTFGGHDMAAGMTLRADNLDAFVEAMSAHAAANISAEQLVPAIRIDCDAAADELDVEVVKQLEALAPFGRGNPVPRLRLSELTVHEAPRQMGAHGRHLSMNLRSDGGSEGSSPRRWLRGVWWSQGALAGDLAAGMLIDAVVRPRLNEWNGRINVEVEIQDVRVRERGTEQS